MAEDITIAHGGISMHVTDLGIDVVGAKVYLFSETGSYLGVNTTTDALGMASFTVPAKAYKLRVDHGGSQYWTEVINILPYQNNPVNLALDLLSLNLTNDPYPQRMDGEGPVYTPPQVASMGSLAGLLSQVVTQAVPASDARVFYYVSDHLSTAQVLLDDQGAVVWQGNYTPFGEVDVVVNTLENNFRFPGQYFDAETGFHYNWNRYYDPITGRYITADPIGLAGGMNLYAYANANPINVTDSLGLYGTNDCSYYDRRCEETGDFYYCHIANNACPPFPTPEDPDPNRDDDYEGFSRCMRQCLQDCDADKQCEEDNWYDPNAAGESHSKCGWECGVNEPGEYPLP